MMIPRSLLVVLLSTVPLADAAAQSRPAAPPSRPAALGRAWAAIDAARYDAADALVERLLAQNPLDHAALIVRLTARSAAGRPAQALDAYEGWLERSKTEDVYLLQPIALEQLAALAQSDDPGIKAMAAARLARFDPERARAILSRAQGEWPDLDATAAALGDAAARSRVAKALGSQMPREKLAALTPIAAGRIAAIDEEAVLPLLADQAPPVRAEAARALAALGSPSAAGAVRPLLQDPDGYVRASAAVALGQLGDEAGLRALEQMLVSPAADSAVMAARVLQARGVDVSAAVERALLDENPLTRLSAVPLVAAADPGRAAALLRAAAGDPNPVTRSRAAEILEQSAITDLALLRSLLRDDSREVQVYAASALLQLAAAR